MKEEMASIEKLLRPGERLDLSGYPWPCPREGDRIRAEILLDVDPQNVTGLGYDSLRSRIANCRVRHAEASVNPGLMIFYYSDDENTPVPERFSAHDTGGYSDWGGASHWKEDGSRHRFDPFIPLHAIKMGLLADYAQTLARRSADIEQGIFS